MHAQVVFNGESSINTKRMSKVDGFDFVMEHLVGEAKSKMRLRFRNGEIVACDGGEYKPWTKHGRNMDDPRINGSITGCAYRAELILGR